MLVVSTGQALGSGKECRGSRHNDFLTQRLGRYDEVVSCVFGNILPYYREKMILYWDIIVNIVRV